MRRDNKIRPLSEKLPDGSYSRTALIGGSRVSTKEYSHWQNMKSRCNTPYWEKYPSYNGISMSDNFKNYDFFVDWCRSQRGFNVDGYTLDKDILSKATGDRVYSEETCSFVPTEINGFLIIKNPNVKHYTGVSFQQECQKFIVSCSQLNGRNKTLARVLCPIAGYEIYRNEKVRLAKILAEKHTGSVDERVCEILRNFDYYIDLFTVNPNNKEKTNEPTT